eukprot:scaffold111326_cov54-Phaeocystis_antarctica.AAC.1
MLLLAPLLVEGFSLQLRPTASRTCAAVAVQPPAAVAPLTWEAQRTRDVHMGLFPDSPAREAAGPGDRDRFGALIKDTGGAPKKAAKKVAKKAAPASTK